MALSNPRKISSGAIANIASLCRALRCSEEDLNYVLAIPAEQRYIPIDIKKDGGKSRPVFNPHHRLRRIQRKINTQIFSDPKIIEWPSYLYGSVPNQIDSDGEKISKDYISCAARHCGARSLLKLDIQSFFDNVHSDIVYQIFSDFLKCGDEVAKILTDICCFKDHLVQGALTSSYLASLCLYDIEGRIAERLHNKGLTYTRLVDDITVSSKSHNMDYSYATRIITQMLVSKDLPVNEGKTKVQRSGSVPLTVHGLRVCFDNPRLPSDEVSRIRAAVRNVESLAKEANYRTTHSYRHDYNRCMGRVNKLQRVGHKQHAPLLKRLKAVRPLPSPRDIGRARDMIKKLVSDFSAKRHTYWYRNRYYRVQERLNVLKETYKHISRDMRLELRNLKPLRPHDPI